jgi:curved DNA-binding protein CbpA
MTAAARNCPATSDALSPESLARLLRELHAGQQTGVLHLSRGGERLSLRFLDGHVLNGSHGPVGRLGDILVRCGRISRLDLDRALEKAALEGRRLGPVLVEEGLASREQVQEALRLQVRDVLFAAFFWGFGAYRFEPDEGPAFDEEISLEISTTSLVFEVVSSLESPRSVLEGLLDVDGPIVAAPDAIERLRKDHANLSAADGYVLSRADGLLRVRQIVETAPLPAQAVERSLVALLCCDAVRPRQAHPSSGRLPGPDDTVALPRAALGLEADRVSRERRLEVEQTLHALEGKSHFEVLGLRAEASAEEIRQAYLRLAKRYHPDVTRDPALADLAKAVFLRVSEAYNVLGSADSRARYEERLGLRPAGFPGREAPPKAVPANPADEVRPLPEPADAVRQAEGLIAAGKPFEASALLEDVLPHAEGRLRTYARLLRVRAFLKTPSGARPAEAELREVLKEEPGCLEAGLMLADLYRDHGLNRRAASQYRRILELHPRHPVATAELRALPLGDLAGRGRLPTPAAR